MRCGVIAAFVIILFLSACSSKQCLFCKSNAEVHLRTENEARVYLEAVIAGVERKATYPCKRPLELALDSAVRSTTRRNCAAVPAGRPRARPGASRKPSGCRGCRIADASRGWRCRRRRESSVARHSETPARPETASTPRAPCARPPAAADAPTDARSTNCRKAGDRTGCPATGSSRAPVWAVARQAGAPSTPSSRA